MLPAQVILSIVVTEEPSNGFNVICHGNGLTANGVAKHVASATVDIHRTPPPSKRSVSLSVAMCRRHFSGIVGPRWPAYLL